MSPRVEGRVRRHAFVLLLLTAFTIPFEDVVQLPGIGTPARLVGLVTFVVWGLAVLATRRLRPPSAFVGWAYALVVWVLASMFWTADPASSVERIATYVQLLALVVIIHDLATTEERVDQLLHAVVLGSSVAAVTVFTSFVRGDEYYYGRFAVPGADPNDTAILLALVLPLAWYIASRTPTGWLRRADLAYLALGTAAIALTGSRAGFVALLLAWGVVLANAWSAPRATRVRLVVGLVVVATLVVVALPDFLVERIGSLGEEVGSGDLNGRVGVWRESLVTFSERPVLGAGAGATRAVLPSGKVAHNLALSLAVEFGITGLLLFLGAAWSAVVAALDVERPRRRMLLAAAAIMGWGSLSLSLETRKLVWVVLALVAVAGAAARDARRQAVPRRADPSPPTALAASAAASANSAPSTSRSAVT